VKLEDEIKQKKFQNEYHKLALNILFTGRWMENNNARFFKQYDLTTQQYNVLRILRGQHPNAASVGDVLSRMLDKSSNITRLVDKLADKKLVTRCENPDNRRMQELKITDMGLDLLKEIDAPMSESMDTLKILTVKEAEHLNLLLDRIRD
jgi:DNA-binding MarR family transcriptional regulator